MTRDIGTQRRALEILLRVIDRFVSRDVLEQAGHERRRSRLVAGIALVWVVLAPVPAASMMLRGRADEGLFALVGWLSACLWLGLLRAGVRSTWVAHLMAATAALPALGSVLLSETLSLFSLGLLATPLMVTLLAGGAHGWPWAGLCAVGFIAALSRADVRAAGLQPWVSALGVTMLGMTVIGYIFERLRQRAVEDLEHARDMARDAAEAKSRFLANMSHEIRTPMNGVLGMLGLLKETSMERQQRDYADTAHASAVALLDVLNDILDFSKIEAGQMTLEEVPFDLRALVEDVLDQMAVLAGQKDLELIARYVPGTPTHVRGDSGRIRQVLLNLVSNAIKFTDKGHVLVTVEHEPGGVGWASFKCSVADTGIGIAPDAQASVFEHFQQVDTASTRRYEGTGLGLAIVRELVQLMEGQLGLRSRLGEGSTFWVSLPLEVVEEVPSQDRAQLPTLRGLSVLIVDDHRINRYVLRELLSRWGMEAEDCDSGQEALRKLGAAAAQGRPFQIAILDYHMPNMDGLELARAIKSSPEIGNTMLVMLSSVVGGMNTGELREAGCAAYLVKPVHQSDLLDTLSSAWGHRSDPDQALGATRRSYVTGPRLAIGDRAPRVLVVEDNVVNQKVAQRMLEELGCRVDVAGNGREALELIEIARYVIVFMDVQMPEMDGLEATRRLRARECGVDPNNPDATADEDAPRRPALPVVAMTAHAMPADRERCLAAGMDAFISKPIRRRDLVRVIRELVVTEDDKPVLRYHDVSAPRRAAVLSVPCDLDALRREYDSDPAAIRELIEMYVERSEELLTEMERADRAKDLEVLGRAAHSLKGISGTIRASRLARMLANEPEVVMERLDEIRQEHGELMAYFASELGVGPAVEGGSS